MYLLGECYQNGDGVGEDIEKAKEWYTKAVALGDGDAKATLEEMLRILVEEEEDIA